MPIIYLIAGLAFSLADVPSIEPENIFAILDEAPLTPNQQKAEALLALEQEACFHTAIIRAHHEGAVYLAGPTLNESRIQRGQARMAQRQYLV